ncbi:MAG: transporter related [Herbinix sp.]|nr:transporter related [Herbinix sp.]
MEYALELKNLSKQYNGFQLENLNLCLPKGSIMGFVGENGAGKSTTIKLILNIIRRNSGEVKLFGLDNIKHNHEIKENIGVVFDGSNFHESMTAAEISMVMRNIYKNWDDSIFRSYLEKFSLPSKKIVKEFSRGMNMKLCIAVALSHHAKLLILDEATSGLDPIIRDEILDVFLDFIQDEEQSIFISSHIISDLEKIADYIAFIHKGKLVFNESKDKLLSEYGVLKCSHGDFEKIDRNHVISYRKNQFGIEALIKRQKLLGKYIIDQASIEDIMLYNIKGEVK